MSNFLLLKSNFRAAPLWNAARIISIMILALLWAARGEAQELPDLDVSSLSFTESDNSVTLTCSDQGAWTYKGGGKVSETPFNGTLTGTQANGKVFLIKSNKAVTSGDPSTYPKLILDDLNYTSDGAVFEASNSKPVYIQTNRASKLVSTDVGTGDAVSVINNYQTSLVIDGGSNGLEIEKNAAYDVDKLYGINDVASSASILLQGKITVQAHNTGAGSSSAIAVITSTLSYGESANIQCMAQSGIYDQGTISSPFLEWTFADAPANGLTLEIRDADGQSLDPAVKFTTDGNAKSFTISAKKDTPYTLWLDGKKQKNSNGATSFMATKNDLIIFTGIKEYTLPSNWSEYAQTANVGPEGADVAVDNTTYTVKTSAGLAWIAWVTNEGKNNMAEAGKYYPATAGFDDCTVTLANDISLAKPTTGDVTSDFDVSWYAIGNAFGKYFKGTFDGGNYTISGLSLTTLSGQYNGLFGYIDGAVIKNLRVVGKIEGEYNGTDDVYVGGIAGYTYGSKIIACSNVVGITVTYNASSSFLFTGGIVGSLSGDSEIHSCWNDASLSGTSSNSGFEIGGIAGRGEGSISNCYSSGSVSGTGVSNNVSCMSGGIVGSLQGTKTLSNCYATGFVWATNSKDNGSAWAGGIVGYSNREVSNCLALNTENNISATVGNGGTANVGRIVGQNNGGSLSKNYASTQIKLQKGSDPAAAPTENIGADAINGADVYLDDVAKAIADWTGSENMKAFTTIDTDEATGKLPQLKTVNYGNDGLPSAYGNSVMEHQPSLTTSGYLGMPTALELSSNDTETITLSCTDNKWSYKKGTDGESNRFNGAIRMVQSVEKSSNPLVVSAITTTDDPTLTFEKVNIDSDGAALTIDAGCTLTINTTGDNTSTLASSAASTIANKGTLTVKGKGLFIINKSTTDTHYGLENSSSFTVDDPSATSVTFHCGNTAIQNTGTLGNPWMEWRFAEAPAGDGNIAFAATDAADQSPAAQSRQDKTFATTVTAGKNYRVWTVDNSDTRILQQGKTSATPAASVISFKAPAEDAPERNLAVFTDVKDAVTVTVSEPTEGGSISVFYDDNLLAATDAIPNGATLTCKYSAIPGYELGSYMATPSGGSSSEASNDPKNSGSYQVPDDATSVAFKATFDEAPSATITEEDVVEEVPTAPVAGPTVVIPQAEQPTLSDESSTIKLLTGNLEEIHKEAVDEVINENVQNHDGLIYAEIALVEVKQDGTKIPIQPSPEHPVKVVYPYPAGTDSDDSFTIVHVKMDGTTEVYSVAEGNLENATAGLKFEVSSFSPFGIAWTKAGSGSGPDPGIDPEPTPVFFTVTLPAVEGAVTDPVAGSYSVEAGENFRFFLTLDKDYDESQPVVSTSRNETIEPFGSTSAYIIENIQSAVMITISGIRKNTAVSNATLDSGLRIRTESSALYIETDRRADIRIVSISGSTLASFEAHPGTTRHPLSPGIYIVKAENQVYKVIIN